MRVVNLDLRPRPIQDAAFNISKILPAVTGIVTGLVMVGLVTSTQANAITITLGAVATLVATVAPLIAAFRVVAQAEPQVTPLSSPMSANGTPLVPVAPAPSGSSYSPVQAATIPPLTADQAAPLIPGTPGATGGPAA